jgi:hypothetical protein
MGGHYVNQIEFKPIRPEGMPERIECPTENPN